MIVGAIIGFVFALVWAGYKESDPGGAAHLKLAVDHWVGSAIILVLWLFIIVGVIGALIAA